MDSYISSILENNKVVVFSKSWCPYWRNVISLLNNALIENEVIDLETHPDGYTISQELSAKIGTTLVPQVFIGGELVGGCDETISAASDGSLASLLNKYEVSHDL